MLYKCHKKISVNNELFIAVNKHECLLYNNIVGTFCPSPKILDFYKHIECKEWSYCDFHGIGKKFSQELNPLIFQKQNTFDPLIMDWLKGLVLGWEKKKLFFFFFKVILFFIKVNQQKATQRWR